MFTLRSTVNENVSIWKIFFCFDRKSVLEGCVCVCFLCVYCFDFFCTFLSLSRVLFLREFRLLELFRSVLLLLTLLMSTATTLLTVTSSPPTQ